MPTTKTATTEGHDGAKATTTKATTTKRHDDQARRRREGLATTTVGVKAGATAGVTTGTNVGAQPSTKSTPKPGLVAKVKNWLTKPYEPPLTTKAKEVGSKAWDYVTMKDVQPISQAQWPKPKVPAPKTQPGIVFTPKTSTYSPCRQVNCAPLGGTGPVVIIKPGPVTVSGVPNGVVGVPYQKKATLPVQPKTYTVNGKPVTIQPNEVTITVGGARTTIPAPDAKVNPETARIWAGKQKPVQTPTTVTPLCQYRAVGCKPAAWLVQPAGGGHADAEGPGQPAQRAQGRVRLRVVPVPDARGRREGQGRSEGHVERDPDEDDRRPGRGVRQPEGLDHCAEAARQGDRHAGAEKRKDGTVSISSNVEVGVLPWGSGALRVGKVFDAKNGNVTVVRVEGSVNKTGTGTVWVINDKTGKVDKMSYVNFGRDIGTFTKDVNGKTVFRPLPFPSPKEVTGPIKDVTTVAMGGTAKDANGDPKKISVVFGALYTTNIVWDARPNCGTATTPCASKGTVAQQKQYDTKLAVTKVAAAKFDGATQDVVDARLAIAYQESNPGKAAPAPAKLRADYQARSQGIDTGSAAYKNGGWKKVAAQLGYGSEAASLTSDGYAPGKTPTTGKGVQVTQVPAKSATPALPDYPAYRNPSIHSVSSGVHSN